ncbi:MAG: ClpXP protease specificity-enhancing factor SspB [Hyphomicrobiaceae bacterium]
MTSGQHIDYDALALEALRGVVKACLTQVARTGLLGDHHFYIAFNTQAPGVGMSKRLKEKYPVEMTIVLQHRFWDLAVDEDRFEVKLTFDGIPERLVVPFAAVKVFYDPSVPYVLQFEEIDPATGSGPARKGPRRIGPPNGHIGGAEGEIPGEGSETTVEKPERRKGRKPRTDRAGDVAADLDKPGLLPASGDDNHSPPAQPVAPVAATPVPTSTGKPTVIAVRGSDGDEEPQQAADEDAAGEDSGGAKIFDLSKFRGKK